MKILKYFFYLLLFVFLIFLAIGILNPQLEYEAEVLVDEPRSKCWEVFTDTTKLSGWILNYQSISTIIEMPDKVDSKYLLTVNDAGKEYQMTETVISFIPEELYSFRIENDVLINTVTYSFTQEGDETLIRATNELRGKDIMMRSIFPLMKGMFVDQANEDLKKLKALIKQS